MRNWSVRQQLLTSFSVVIAIFIVTSLFSVMTTRGIDAALSANSEENSVIQRIAINFRGSVHDRAIALRDIMLHKSLEGINQEVQLIDKLADFYAKSGSELATMQQKGGLPAEVNAMVRDIAAIEAATLSTTREVIEKARAGDNAGAQALLPTARQQYEQWLAAINKLIDFEELRIRTNNNIAQTDAENFTTIMLLLTAVAAAVALGAALWVSSQIVRQLGAEPQTVRDIVLSMQQGNLTTPVQVAAEDNRSVMAAVRDMQQRFHTLVSDVHYNIAELQRTSMDIDSGYTSLGQRTLQASDSLDRTSSSMEQLTTTVHQSADSARQAYSLADTAAQAANKGGQMMEQVVSTMQDIHASSRKINDIISVIDGIAFQTNILALNAAVEAARAGEQGRGFAVVAAEVRNLAQRSAAAAKEIAQLIQTSVDKISSGSTQVSEAGQAMSEIVQHVQSVSAIIGEISSAAVEQSDGISQVNTAVAQLDQMTQQNTSLVEQSGQAVGQLKAQAQRLSESVSQFNIGAIPHAGKFAAQHPGQLRITG